MSDFTVQQVQPILAVRDLATTLSYYTAVLAFTDSWTWGAPPSHGGASLGRAGLQFSQDPERTARAPGMEQFFFVRNIDVLYERHCGAGASILSPLEVKPWLMREYTVRDPDGYHLRFAQEHAATAGPKRPARDDIPIIDRAPSLDEYTRLIRAVGWAAYTDLSRAQEAIDAARYVVVAADGDRAIGTGLVLGDGASFFYLKDVMIDPAYQQMGIGRRLVARLMSHIASAGASRSLVGLYTGAGLAKFYETFGFAGPDRGLYGMTQRL